MRKNRMHQFLRRSLQKAPLNSITARLGGTVGGATPAAPFDVRCPGLRVSITRNARHMRK